MRDHVIQNVAGKPLLKTDAGYWAVEARNSVAAEQRDEDNTRDTVFVRGSCSTCGE